MPDRVISVPQAAQIATKIKNKFDTVNGRLQQQATNIGDLSELETEDKTDLVSAINEARQSGGGEGSKNVIPEKVFYAYIYGASPYEIRTSVAPATAVYKIEPGVSYTLRTSTPRSRFRFGQYTAEPVIGSRPINGTYVNKDDVMVVSITPVETAQYIAVWFFNNDTDTDTPAEALAGLTLTNNDIIPAGYVESRGEIKPQNILFVYIHDSNKTVVEDRGSVNCRTAVYSAKPDATYEVFCDPIPTRIRIGLASGAVAKNTVLTDVFIPSGRHKFKFKTASNTANIAIYFFDSTKGDTDEAAVLNSIKLIGPAIVTPAEAVTVANNDAEALITPKDTFNICAWNIGHYHMGIGPNTDIKPATYVSKLKSFCRLIGDIDADIIALSEYSEIFYSNMTAEELIFPAFKEHYIGVQRRYSCNAVYSNLHLRGSTLHDYDCLENETITHTTSITAQDYYYIKQSVVIGGRDTTVIATHFAFDTNRPEVLQAAQIAELIQLCASDPYVIIMGDLNTRTAATLAAFTEAGYTVTPTLPVLYQFIDDLTYVVVKGFDILETATDKASRDLSDHSILCTTLRPQ